MAIGCFIFISFMNWYHIPLIDCLRSHRYLYWFEWFSFDDEHFQTWNSIANFFKVTTKIKWATKLNKTGFGYPLQIYFRSEIISLIYFINDCTQSFSLASDYTKAFWCTHFILKYLIRSREMDAKLEQNTNFKNISNFNSMKIEMIIIIVVKFVQCRNFIRFRWVLWCNQ